MSWLAMSIFIEVSDPEAREELADIFHQVAQLEGGDDDGSGAQAQEAVADRLGKIGFAKPPEGFYCGFETHEDGSLLSLQLSTRLVDDEIRVTPDLDGDLVRFGYEANFVLFEDYQDKLADLLHFYSSGSDTAASAIVDWSGQLPCKIEVYRSQDGQLTRLYSTGDDAQIDAACNELDEDGVYTKEETDFFAVLRTAGIL